MKFTQLFKRPLNPRSRRVQSGCGLVGGGQPPDLPNAPHRPVCLVGAAPIVDIAMPKGGVQNGRVGTNRGHGTRNDIHGSLSIVWQYGAKGSSTHGRDARGVVLAAQAEHVGRGPSGRQCTVAGQEGMICSGGPARSTRAAHKTTKEREGAATQARAAANTKRRLGEIGEYPDLWSTTLSLTPRDETAQRRGELTT